MLSAIPWRWVFALGVMGVLAFSGTDKYRLFAQQARVRGCIANQSTLAKAIGVWESQNVQLPADATAWIDVTTGGRVARVSPKLAGASAPWQAVPAQAKLVRDADVLFRYTRDVNLFRCPQRYSALRDRLGARETGKYLEENPEVHYRWVGGRGVCLLHGEIGPREDPDLVHAEARR